MASTGWMAAGIALAMLLPIAAAVPASALTARQFLESIVPHVGPAPAAPSERRRVHPRRTPPLAVLPPEKPDPAASPMAVPMPKPEAKAEPALPEAKPLVPEAKPAPPEARPEPEAEAALPQAKPDDAPVATVSPEQIEPVLPPIGPLAFAPAMPGAEALGAVVSPEAPARPAEADQQETPETDDGVPLPHARPAPMPAAFVVPPRPAVPAATLAACSAGMAALGIKADPEPAVSEGPCGAPDPFRVTALAGGSVKLEPAARLNCEAASMLAHWLDDDVQPAAKAAYGQPVTALAIADSYSCRGRNQIVGAKLSEHSFMNAVDVGAFTIGDRKVTVEKTSEQTATDTGFVATVRQAACARFMTVLGPGSDAYHANHLHLDMIHRGRNGDSRFCQ